MNLDQVFPQVFVGTYPETTADVDRLRQDFGVTAVLNLHTDEDIDDQNVPWAALEEHYRRSGIELRRVPVRDFDQDDLRRNLPECVRVLRELIEGGHTVYVHCTAGMGRSPSVVVAYLHWVERRDLGEAFDHMNSCRPCSPDVAAIRLAGDDFAD
ncbi:MAG TPA: dual specificity protein phosphatase family protein [Thermoguttaceae bacterium]|nr:dual specificity protein phosphatase family protein [Thermoguttaceae bacterium]